MVHPLEVQQVHVVADGLQAHGNAVDVVAAVKAVDPRAKDGLTLNGGPVVDQLQRLGGAHAVVVEPAGEDQRGDARALAAGLPVGHLPQFVVVRVLEPGVEKVDVLADGLPGHAFQRADLQHVVPVVPHHAGGVHLMVGHRKGPGHHAGFKAAAPAGNVGKGAARRDHADERLQMGVAAGRCAPLHIAQVRPADHAHAAVAPFLPGEPVQRVVSVLHLMVAGQKIALACAAAAHVLNGERIAAAHEVEIIPRSSCFVVWRAHQHHRHGALGIAGHIDIRGKPYPIPRGHHKGAQRAHRACRLRRRIGKPRARGRACLPAVLHQHRGSVAV